MKVKMILPALTEATGPFWRPIGIRCFRRLAWRRWLGFWETMTTSIFRTSTSSNSMSTTSRIWSSFRSTSPRRPVPTGSPITTVAEARTWRSAAFT